MADGNRLAHRCCGLRRLRLNVDRQHGWTASAGAEVENAARDRAGYARAAGSGLWPWWRPACHHRHSMADLAPGHSLAERLLGEGLDHLALVEWKSAGPQTQYLGIDDYLLRLSAALDDIGRPS